MNIPATELDQESLVLSAGLIHSAEKEALVSGRMVIEVLQEMLLCSSEQFIILLAKSFGYTSITASEMHALEPAFDLLPLSDSGRLDCVILRDENSGANAVIANPFSSGLRTWLENNIHVPFSWKIAHLADIRAFVARHEDNLRALGNNIGGTLHEGQQSTENIEELSLRIINEQTSPVIKLVHSTLYDALKISASDIHLETSPIGLSVKYRIDGVLNMAGNAPGLEFAEQIISRIKVMAELDIAERRVPQDGRFKMRTNGREIDFRVSIMPSIFGEDAVLRILDKRTLADQMSGLRLDVLGFDKETIAMLRKMSNEPYGMVLVTGPTGSGKTTTLYGALTEINRGEDKIITIEDPVEYQLPGILQIPVNEKKGLTFARGLRSILRHDPDRVMVGEIRDEETAQIAVQAALTGHLVFTTVHANGVLDVINRFLHMSVSAHSFVSALNGIVAQRLVRVNCAHCSQTFIPDNTLLVESGIGTGYLGGEYNFRAGQGCGQCRGTGYKGRRAIAEVLRLNDEIRAAIIAQETPKNLKEMARRNGTRFLRDCAVDLVRQGETTLQEINRVTVVE